MVGETAGLRGELGAVTEWGGGGKRDRESFLNVMHVHTEIEILLLVVNFSMICSIFPHTFP